MSRFRDFFRRLAKPEDVAVQDAWKAQMRQQIKRQWVDRVLVDTDLDDLIFNYTEIFPLDEKMALSGGNPRDQMDILESVGIKLELERPPKEAFHQ